MSPRKYFVMAFAVALLVGQTSQAAITFFGADTAFSVASNPEDMYPADMDGDGMEDVVVVSRQSDSVGILISEPDQPSRFRLVAVEKFGTQLRHGAVGDVTRDGIPDFVVPDQRQNGVWVLVGDGQGRLTNPGFFPVGRSPFAVAIADFDGLRGADIAVVDQRLANVTILLNDGGSPPRFSRGPIYAVGDNPRTVIAMDVNGDGRPDIVTLNEGGRRVKSISVLLFQSVTAGLPVFGPAQDFGVGERPSEMKAADLNGDGLEDLYMLTRPTGTGNSEIDILLSRGDGTLVGPTSFPVPCPFFTGGVICRSRTLIAGDFDNNGTTDMAVMITDPRRVGIGAGAEFDAMQIFGGRGDGQFFGGPVLRIPKVPLAAVAVNLNGDNLIDLAVSFQRSSSVLAFTNVSTPGGGANGDRCVVGGECFSGLCIQATCCAAPCADDESCAIPGRAGTCQRIAPVIPCDFDDECFDIPNDGDPGICRDNFCCENNCTDGRCDIDGFEGLCIPTSPNGTECFDERDCRSGFCVDGRCCAESCDRGFCGNALGICMPREGVGTPCDFDEECETGICDEFDLICCSDVCRDDEVCGEDGECFVVDPNPGEGEQGDSCRNGNDCLNQQCVNGVCCATASCPAGELCQPPNGECAAEPTATPTPIPRANGSSCDEPGECVSSNCVDFVCCATASCPDGQFCSAAAGGMCQVGVPPATPTPTPIEVCDGVPCATGRTCIERDGRGVCVDSCDGGFCEPGESCVPAAIGGGRLCVDSCRDVQCDAGATCVVGISGEPICAIPCGPNAFCEPGEICEINALAGPQCVRSSRSGGCDVAQGRSMMDLWALALLPIALWMLRRRVLPNRVAVRSRRR